MKKLIKLISSINFVFIGVTNATGCSPETSFEYYDDRTPLQLMDASYLLDTKLNLNSDKHVLLLGLDGIPYNNIPELALTASVFKSNYWIQNYETVRGWSSILWGNVLKKESNIFQLIKQNNNTLKTANITQWMGNWYYNQIYGSNSASNMDFNSDFADQADVSNYDTKEKMLNCFNELLKLGNEKIAQGYNFIFLYNAFFDELKHKHYYDNDPLIVYLFEQYNQIIYNFYKTLDSSKWLIISTTDHGRGGLYNFNHAMTDANAHYSWTLSNNDLNSILGHNFTNFYDIRTAVMKWLTS